MENRKNQKALPGKGPSGTDERHHTGQTEHQGDPLLSVCLLPVDQPVQQDHQRRVGEIQRRGDARINEADGLKEQ